MSNMFGSTRITPRNEPEHRTFMDQGLLNDLIALVALTAMEIVLGIDNVVFISISTSRLPLEQQKRARTIGLAAAMLMRIALLFAISWVVQAKQPIFSLS